MSSIITRCDVRGYDIVSYASVGDVCMHNTDPEKGGWWCPWLKVVATAREGRRRPHRVGMQGRGKRLHERASPVEDDAETGFTRLKGGHIREDGFEGGCPGLR